MDLLAGIFGFLFMLCRVVFGMALFLVRAHIAFVRHLFSKAADQGDDFVKPQTKRQ